MKMNFLAQKRKKILLGETQDHTARNARPFSDFYYKQIAKLTASGGWGANFIEKKSFLDPEARRILNVPESFIPSLKNALDFYPPEHQKLAAETFYACSQGKPVSIVIKMLTYDKKPFWAKATGTPVFDSQDRIIGVQGVFQDITELKNKEISLEKSLRIIESQNATMANFAHTISHNLRSNINNLSLTLELLKEGTINDDIDLKEGLFEISNNLNATMAHLNEIISSQSKSVKEKETVFFHEILDKVKNSLSVKIYEAEAEIFSEFSEAPKLSYIPHYLESILMNLVSNAIKYKHPERKPIIDVYTLQEDDKITLVVKDNGLGINLEKHGNKIFNMYQTFHDNSDAVGIGLFIVKNQVEILQGTIDVESCEGEGTTFKICF